MVNRHVINPAATSILLYFLLNLFVTVSNKKIMSEIAGSPNLLTAAHATSSFIGCTLFRHVNGFDDHPMVSITRRKRLTLTLFSSLYTLNIAISNLSLGLISLTMHQTIRATAPAITVVISLIILRQSLSSFSNSTYLSLIPITLGVVVATYSTDGSSDAIGVAITLIGAVLAVIKTIVTNTIQTSGSRVPALQLLRILSPYAAIQGLIFAKLSHEFAKVRFKDIGSTETFTLITNFTAAFALNLASFEANKRCGPVAMAVAANLKQVAILLVPANGRSAERRVVVGSLMTVAGGLWYAISRQRDRPDEQFEGGISHTRELPTSRVQCRVGRHRGRTV